MKPFAVTIEERRQRRVTVPAETPEQARAMVLATMPGFARVLSVVDLSAPLVAAGEPAEALAHLAAIPFMSDGLGLTTLRDWVLRGQSAPQRAEVNARLALAGLRLGEGTLSIGSPASVPVLALWLRATPWAGQRLLTVLATLPGARRSNLTFAGVRSRCVVLPVRAFLPIERAA
jgi:hypothetical protein